jgi:PRTRC genetic system ThiF family protein
MSSAFETVVRVDTRVTADQDDDPLNRRPKILVLGVGGTGGWVVPHVLRLVKTLGIGSVVLADGDIVEPKNLTRQNFIETDLGENKAVALARRYSAAFGLPVRAIPGYLEDPRGLVRQHPEIILGCVDRHAARRMVAEYLTIGYGPTVWIDAGNETATGQVVCGYAHSIQYRPGSFRGAGPIQVALPTVSQLFPLPETETRPSCADQRELSEQISTVNVVASGIMINFLRLVLEDSKRRLEGQRPHGLEFHAITFNVMNGGYSTRWNSPENLKDATKPLAPWRS